jgi:glycosyltransferase involved in cell wall biosynthesis
MRSVFWGHVSGLFRPVIAPGLFKAADRFVFTTPASMVLGEGLPIDRQSNLSAIGSGFGFPNLPSLPGSQKLDAQYPITYLGTVDFIKMHPGFFDAVDALAHDVAVSIWGGNDPEGEVAAKTRTMHHPGRIHFMGQTPDPQAALSRSRIFFYPLQPDHYGTAENALIEAMSLGLVPVVLANSAECAIVEHCVTGLAAASIDECADILDRLLDSPVEVARLGANAAKAAREKHTSERSASAFISLWRSLIKEPKRCHDFAAVTGRTPLDWYLATQFLPGDEIVLSDASARQSKGTLAHFRSAFPDDPCWNAL